MLFINNKISKIRREKLIQRNFKFQIKSKWQKKKAFILLKGNNSKNTLVCVLRKSYSRNSWEQKKLVETKTDQLRKSDRKKPNMK